MEEIKKGGGDISTMQKEQQHLRHKPYHQGPFFLLSTVYSGIDVYLCSFNTTQILGA